MCPHHSHSGPLFSGGPSSSRVHRSGRLTYNMSAPCLHLQQATGKARHSLRHLGSGGHPVLTFSHCWFVHGFGRFESILGNRLFSHPGKFTPVHLPSQAEEDPGLRHQWKAGRNSQHAQGSQTERYGAQDSQAATMCFINLEMSWHSPGTGAVKLGGG